MEERSQPATFARMSDQKAGSATDKNERSRRAKTPSGMRSNEKRPEGSAVEAAPNLAAAGFAIRKLGTLHLRGSLAELVELSARAR